MDFPPLDDARWDRLLGAVIDQRPTVGDPAAPLSTSFPTLPRTARHQPPVERSDESSDSSRTIHLGHV